MAKDLIYLAFNEKSKVIEKADKIYKKYYGVNYGYNFVDLDIILSKEGIQLFSANLSIQNILSTITIDKNFIGIAIDEKLSAEEKNFLVARELWYYFYHKSKGNISGTENLKMKNDDLTIHTEYSIKIQEKTEEAIRADYFAINLLLPEEKVRNILNMSIFSGVFKDTIEFLVIHFKVPIKIIKMRLYELGYGLYE